VRVLVRVIKFELSFYIYLLMGDSREAECKQTGDGYNSDKIVMWRLLRNRQLIVRLHTIFMALICIGRIARSSLR